MFCSKCGKEILDGAAFCPFCGNQLNVTTVVVDSGLSVLIPNNTYALWAYYLGLFSFLCGITAIPAIITGILGVRYARRHPEAKGAIHAWVGIITGFLAIAVMVFFLMVSIRSL